MQLAEVSACLIEHGCVDITSELDLERCMQQPLVQGGFGVVYRGMLSSGRPVAIKCVEVSGCRPKSLKHTALEMYAWSKCEHPGILGVLGFARFGNHILLVSPWMEKGSIPSYIAGNPLCNRLQMCVELAEAVEYLHSKGIVHGDIKGENVIVSNHGHAQLVDFGSAQFTGHATLQFTQTGRGYPDGTLRYMAPELLNRTSDKHSCETDIYALGMTVLQIMTGQPPYADIRFGPAVIFEVAVNKSPPVRSDDFGQYFASKEAEDKLWDLLTRCWAHEPRDRPTAMKVREVLVGITYN